MAPSKVEDPCGGGGGPGVSPPVAPVSGGGSAADRARLGSVHPQGHPRAVAGRKPVERGAESAAVSRARGRAAGLTGKLRGVCGLRSAAAAIMFVHPHRRVTAQGLDVVFAGTDEPCDVTFSDLTRESGAPTQRPWKLRDFAGALRGEDIWVVYTRPGRRPVGMGDTLAPRAEATPIPFIHFSEDGAHAVFGGPPSVRRAVVWITYDQLQGKTLDPDQSAAVAHMFDDLAVNGRPPARGVGRRRGRAAPDSGSAPCPPASPRGAGPEAYVPAEDDDDVCVVSEVEEAAPPHARTFDGPAIGGRVPAREPVRSSLDQLEEEGVPLARTRARAEARALLARSLSARTGQSVTVRQMRGDGNCLFRAFAQALSGTPEDHHTYRQRAAQELEARPGPYAASFVGSPAQWGEYVRGHAVEGKEAGERHVAALARATRRAVTVWQVDPPRGRTSMHHLRSGHRRLGGPWG